MEIISLLVTTVLGGGGGAVVALLIAMIVFLIWDRMRLTKTIDTKDERIDKIITDYNEGNISITEALNNLRLILAEIKERL